MAPNGHMDFLSLMRTDFSQIYLNLSPNLSLGRRHLQLV